MYQFDIQIIDNSRISPIFIKVNSFLFKKYQREFTSIVLNKENFKSLWFKEFGVVLEYDENLCIWKSIKFLTEKEKVAFALKWGS
jgi:hypothetical protein